MQTAGSLESGSRLHACVRLSSIADISEQSSVISIHMRNKVICWYEQYNLTFCASLKTLLPQRAVKTTLACKTFANVAQLDLRYGPMHSVTLMPNNKSQNECTRRIQMKKMFKNNNNNYHHIILWQKLRQGDMGLSDIEQSGTNSRHQNRIMYSLQEDENSARNDRPASEAACWDWCPSALG